jgi:hypothetical protein
MLLATFLCQNNHSLTWKSQSTENYYSSGNVQLSAAMYLCGLNFSKFETLCKTAGIQLFSNHTYYRIIKNLAIPCIKHTWNVQRNALLTNIKSSNTCAVAGDGQFDSPGFSAKYVTYSLMDLETDKILDFIVLQRGQVDGELEKQACDRLLSKFEAKGVKFKLFLSDRHIGIRCMMKQKYSHIEHQFDVWHLAKSLVKRLKSVDKKAPLLGAWRSSIVNHLWWSAATCNGDAEVLLEKFKSVLNHISNVHSWEGNKHFQKCDHPPISDSESREKMWISPGSADYRYLKDVIEDKRWLKDLTHINKYCHTGLLECYHNVWLKYLPKRSHFSYDGMVARGILAVLDHNANVKRLKIKEKLQWSKAQKKWIYKKLPAAKSNEWRQNLLTEIRSFVKHKDVSFSTDNEDEYYAEVPANIAPTERPSMSEARQKHFSRFNV